MSMALDIGQRRLCKAQRQGNAMISPLQCIDPGFDRRRSGGKNDRKAVDMRAHHRHVACMVADAIFLLVGRVMLLIDNDEAEFLEGQEQRRTRAGYDAHTALRHLPPDTLAHTRRQVRVPLGRSCAETVVEPLQKCLRKGDLRQQDQNLPAALECCGHRLEIDLRFPRTGNAVDNRNAECIACSAVAKDCGGGLLIGRQFRCGVGRVG